MKKQILIFGVFSALILFSIFLATNSFLFSDYSSIPNVGVKQSMDISAKKVCVYLTRSNGEIEDLGCSHNIVTNNGKDAIENSLRLGTRIGNFTAIGLCNVTAGCTPAITDTLIDNNFTSCGMAPGYGTSGDIGTGNYSVWYQFTSTCDNIRTNVTGLMNQTDSGYLLLALVNFTEATLQTNDKLTVNFTEISMS